MKKRFFLSSVMMIVLCTVMITGATFALFTSESKTNITIQSGKVDVVTSVEEYKLYSMGALQTGNFENGGTAEYVEDENKLVLQYMTPGDKVVLQVKVENNSNVKIQYKVSFVVEGELAPALVASAKTADGEEVIELDKWYLIEAGAEISDFEVSIELPVEVGNEYQNKTAEAYLKVEATQGNTPRVSTWDGESESISWLFENEGTEEDPYQINTAADLAGLASLVDGTATSLLSGGATLPDNFNATFVDKTFKLNSDLDLYSLDENGNRVCFEPIGDASNADFSGIFDGQGHTIYNLYQDCNSKHLGLFGAVYEGTVKNLTLDNARIENNGDGYASAIAAYAGASTFEKITIKNSTVVNYNHNTGGVVGWCSNNGTTTVFDEIRIESSTTIGSWWGSPDSRVGGIVGAMNTGNNIVIKNSYVACQLDVHNDVVSNYQWYNYRMAGMLVGDVRDTETVEGRTQANPARVTCENVTVEFGDWANYHYCESASYGTPSYADPGEYKFNRVEAGLGYGGIDISTCNHAEDESHNILLTFDFLFGARDGKGIYGISSFEGVTIIK